MTGPKEAFDFCYFACTEEALVIGHYCGVGSERFESVFEEAITAKTFSIKELETLDCNHFVKITIDESKLMIFIRKNRGISEFTSFLAETLEIFNSSHLAFNNVSVKGSGSLGTKSTPNCEPTSISNQNSPFSLSISPRFKGGKLIEWFKAAFKSASIVLPQFKQTNCFVPFFLLSLWVNPQALQR